MRVLMFTWEYPPRCVGGLAEHAYHLSNSLADMGVEVSVLTCADGGSLSSESGDRRAPLSVERIAPYEPRPRDFTDWVFHLNVAMLERAISRISESGMFDIIHAHDWMVSFAARVLKHGYKIPMVATIHATERGRHNGIHNDDQRYINDCEWWLTYDAWRVICCSEYMRDHLRSIFQLPPDKLRVINNGIDLERVSIKNDSLDRERFARADERAVVFVGRLVPEKGVQVLLDAVPKVLRRCHDAKFIVVGSGPHEDELRRIASSLGVGEKVQFTGYVDIATKNTLLGWAEAVVIPSLYEPFGIVALEAMGSEVPVIASATGGLTEVINDRVDGLLVPPGNAEALASAICRVLFNPGAARLMAKRARSKVARSFGWAGVARRTVEVYDEVIGESRRCDWSLQSERWGRAPVLALRSRNRFLSRLANYGSRYQKGLEDKAGRPPAPEWGGAQCKR